MGVLAGTYWLHTFLAGVWSIGGGLPYCGPPVVAELFD
jgi:hypothetical protein